MNIQDDFSTTLKQIRLQRGLTMREFSAELGISLSSLVEYEAGRRVPRVDTLGLIAQNLGKSPADLISAPTYSDRSVQDCLDDLSRKIQSLHPNARNTAEHALKMLAFAFRSSDEYFFMENHAAPPERPSDRFRYSLHESHSFLQALPSYGILVDERREDVWTTAAVFAPFSNNRLTVLHMVFTANELQLPPDKFFSEIFPRFGPFS